MMSVDKQETMPDGSLLAPRRLPKKFIDIPQSTVNRYGELQERQRGYLNW
jgi:hypothetical protein